MSKRYSINYETIYGIKKRKRIRKSRGIANFNNKADKGKKSTKVHKT